MCYKHGCPPKQQQQQQQQGSPSETGHQKVTLFPSSYFKRVASQQGCTQCQERVTPEEVKSALGVCTVYLMHKTVQWITSK